MGLTSFMNDIKKKLSNMEETIDNNVEKSIKPTCKYNESDITNLKDIVRNKEILREKIQDLQNKTPDYWYDNQKTLQDCERDINNSDYFPVFHNDKCRRYKNKYYNYKKINTVLDEELNTNNSKELDENECHNECSGDENCKAYQFDKNFPLDRRCSLYRLDDTYYENGNKPNDKSFEQNPDKNLFVKNYYEMERQNINKERINKLNNELEEKFNNQFTNDLPPKYRDTLGNNGKQNIITSLGENSPTSNDERNVKNLLNEGIPITESNYNNINDDYKTKIEQRRDEINKTTNLLLIEQDKYSLKQNIHWLLKYIVIFLIIGLIFLICYHSLDLFKNNKSSNNKSNNKSSNNRLSNNKSSNNRLSNNKPPNTRANNKPFNTRPNLKPPNARPNLKPPNARPSNNVNNNNNISINSLITKHNS